MEALSFLSASDSEACVCRVSSLICLLVRDLDELELNLSPERRQTAELQISMLRDRLHSLEVSPGACRASEHLLARPGALPHLFARWTFCTHGDGWTHPPCCMPVCRLVVGGSGEPGPGGHREGYDR